MDLYTKPEKREACFKYRPEIILAILFCNLKLRKSTNLILEFYMEEIRIALIALVTKISSLLSQNTAQSIYTLYRQNTNS